ncbi:UNVERIFIED_CONTAM: hypothetical protein K2H54_001167 [Gekko kuhli]
MAVQKLALSFALAWLLLAGLFPMGEATASRCKQKQVRERKPTVETVRWQEACLPLAVIVGGCCGLVWWVLLVIYDVSQKGGEKGFPQISGEVEPEELGEQKTTDLDHPEEWTQTEAGIKWDYKAASKGNVSPRVEFGPCPPSQPKEQGHTTFWAYLEQELEKILLAIRRHQTSRQNPAAEEQMNPPAVEKPNPPAVEKPSPPVVESPSPVLGDWQSFLAHIKRFPLPTEGQSSPAMDKQHLQPGEGPSSQAADKQSPQPEEGQSPPAKDRQSPPTGEMQSSPNRTRARSRSKKSPKRTRARSRSKKRSTTSPSSRSRGRSSGRRRPCC